MQNHKKMLVKVPGDVVRTCFHHALSSEQEEVMGMLFGQKTLGLDGIVIEIHSLRIVPRLDKRKDRVEISDDQMVKTLQEAEEQKLQIVGWYHSHPNITVWPSHVDLRTQFNYQRMDKLFVGLIFSVFCAEKEKHTHSYQMIAFQAVEDENNQLVQKLIEIETISTDDKLSKNVGEEMVRLSDIICQENLDLSARNSSSKYDALSSMRRDLGKSKISYLHNSSLKVS